MVQIGLLVVNVITALLIGIIGYFIKRTIEEFSAKLTKHDDAIFQLAGNVQRLIGFQEAFTERRKQARN
jgi:fluoride ion exporter CrcB/FEX